MNLLEKRKKELDEQRDKRKELVISAAIDVFIEKGIENSKITDIAEKAQVGVASVYRYFKNKTEIVIEAAICFWSIEMDAFFNIFLNNDFRQLNGLDKVRKILDIFIEIFINNKDFFRFVEEFDNYVIKKKIPPKRLHIYEENILKLMPIVIEAMEIGKKDGSINPNINNEHYYITITQTLMSFSQKLILRNIILSSDYKFEEITQLELVKDMIIKYLKNEDYKVV